MPTSWKQLYAIKRKRENQIKKLCPEADKKSGVYCFCRIDENGFRHAYIGQNAKNNLIGRCADHLRGFPQHIDNSIAKYGLYDANKNPYGYKLKVLCYCKPEECDEREQFFIKQYHDSGWQLKNVEIGGKTGKSDFNERKPAKGYRDGLAQGEKNAKKFVRNLFEKHLNYSIKSQKPNKTQEKMKAKFEEWLHTL